MKIQIRQQRKQELYEELDSSEFITYRLKFVQLVWLSRMIGPGLVCAKSYFSSGTVHVLVCANSYFSSGAVHAKEKDSESLITIVGRALKTKGISHFVSIHLRTRVFGALTPDATPSAFVFVFGRS